MSRKVKISKDIVRYVLGRKKANQDLSCRKISEEASQRFKIKISKSSVNAILKRDHVSSPVGRRVARVYRPSCESEDVGFAFMFGANLALGLSKTVASVIKKIHPGVRVSLEDLEALTEAWLLAKAIYNVPLEKIENYGKSELWLMTGRKIGKGNLREYVALLNVLQTINSQLVIDLSGLFSDVHFFRLTLEGGAQLMIDGQARGVWRQQKIPLEFCTTLYMANSYINTLLSEKDPLVVFNFQPENLSPEDLSDFVFGIDGTSFYRRLRKIEFIAPGGRVVRHMDFVVPGRRKFIIGIGAKQYKAIAELEKKPAQGRLFIEPLGKGFVYSEAILDFSQPIDNNILKIRLILIKEEADRTENKIAVLTNLNSAEWSVRQVAETYLRHFPDRDAANRLFLKSLKAPLRQEDFVAGEKMLQSARRLQEITDPDAFFTILVDVLHLFSERSFFSPDCAGWSFPKMRELFYKKRGLVKRDMADDIVFNMFTDNELEYKNFLYDACARFNELPVHDFSSRKLWILTSQK